MLFQFHASDRNRTKDPLNLRSLSSDIHRSFFEDSSKWSSEIPESQSDDSLFPYSLIYRVSSFLFSSSASEFSHSRLTFLVRVHSRNCETMINVGNRSAESRLIISISTIAFLPLSDSFHLKFVGIRFFNQNRFDILFDIFLFFPY
jgi:hypothetical protein